MIEALWFWYENIMPSGAWEYMNHKGTIYYVYLYSPWIDL